MKWWQNKRRVGLVAGAVVALLAVVTAVLVAVRVDRTATPTQEPSSTPTATPTATPTTTSTTDTTSFAVYFHQGTPDDPRKVVAVPRTVPKTVRVLTDKGTTEIGRGFVTGGGDAPRPFAGTITFAQPNGDGGWVLFQEFSAANGDVVLTTAVRVGFGAVQPTVTANR